MEDIMTTFYNDNYLAEPVTPNTLQDGLYTGTCEEKEDGIYLEALMPDNSYQWIKEVSK
jgi:hypothetical protein